MAVPPTSPRLPSPPPAPEIQFGPKSPGMDEGGNEAENMIEKAILEANSARRIHPGTKAADMATGPPLIPLSQVRATTLRGVSSELIAQQLNSPFQLQEHLKALHYSQTRPSASHEVPLNRESAQLIASPPQGVDRALWLYELCRFLISKCNDLIVGFLFDTPPCSAQSCPEMRASEWQFLCAVHEQPNSCCAIDYCCHTLDWAANTVTSQKIFPSRLSLGSGDGNEDNHAGVKHLTNIFRRLHRIFAHAWFQHREVFWRIEGETGLYVLFKTVCDTYDLLPAENFKLPPEAEGLESQPEPRLPPRQIMKAQDRSSSQDGAEDESYKSIGRNNTRRHIRSSPSTGSSVMTVPEADEEESKHLAERVTMAHRLSNMKIEEEEKESGVKPHPGANEQRRYSPTESEVTQFEYKDEEETIEKDETTQEEDVEPKLEEVMDDTDIAPLKSDEPASSPQSSPTDGETNDNTKEESEEEPEEDVPKPEHNEGTWAEHIADATKGSNETVQPVDKPDLDEQSSSLTNDEKEETVSKKDEAE